MTEGPHAPKYVFVYTYPGYLSTRTYYLKWIEAYRKALIPVYAVCRTKKLKMEKKLFDMDAHGPPLITVVEISQMAAPMISFNFQFWCFLQRGRSIVLL